MFGGLIAHAFSEAMGVTNRHDEKSVAGPDDDEEETFEYPLEYVAHLLPGPPVDMLSQGGYLGGL